MDAAEGILRAATALLSDEGVEALTVRRIAERAGVSTMGVYSRFGGKSGVVEALYLQGFERLREAIDALPKREDPLERLVAYGLCYRATALENASHYAVMFGRAVPGFSPSEAARAGALGAFELIVAAARDAVHGGRIRGRSRSVATELWALTHGHVSLELSGDLPSGDEGEARLRTALAHALAGLGARERDA